MSNLPSRQDINEVIKLHVDLNGRPITIQHFLEVEITRGIDRTVSYARLVGVWNQTKDPLSFRKFQTATITVAGKGGKPDTLMLTGFISHLSNKIDKDRQIFTLMIRSKTAHLVDCMTVRRDGSPPPMQYWVNSPLSTIAIDLCSTFGINVVVEKDENGVPADGIPNPTGGGGLGYDVIPTPNETCFEILEKISRMVEVLLTDDEKGDLVLTHAGAAKASNSFLTGDNILMVDVEEDGTHQYSDYYVLTQTPPAPQNVEKKQNTAAGVIKNNHKGTSVVQSNLQKYAESAAARNNIPKELFNELIYSESTWNPNALNHSTGAAGLGQFTPDTYTHGWDGHPGPFDPYDATTALDASSDYLKYLYSTNRIMPNSWEGAIRAYKGYKSMRPPDSNDVKSINLAITADYGGVMPTPTDTPPATGTTAGYVSGFRPYQPYVHAVDEKVPVFRPYVYIGEVNLPIEYIQERADWMRTYNRGQSLKVRITVPAWRQSNGDLWRSNLQVPVLNVPLLNDDFAQLVTKDKTGNTGLYLLIVEVKLKYTPEKGFVSEFMMGPIDGYKPSKGQVLHIPYNPPPNPNKVPQ